MKTLENFVTCMQKGDNVGLADLFDENGILHDSSWIKVGKDVLHLEGKMAIEMMYHHKFGFNGGPFKIDSIRYQSERRVTYMTNYGGQIVPVFVYLTEVTAEGKIKKINIYPM